MKREYDFSKGEQGKFFRPGAKISFAGQPQVLPKAGELPPAQMPAQLSRERPQCG
ncbi:MAG TPA: hypothetical protein VH988_28690 [Thermoanaerobaculia bacterium]|jgi:hypothetical protein|nr:hypothetical protein [Thermoanaerobaculia bacterium]